MEGVSKKSSPKTKKRPIAVVAIDIEARGQGALSHGIISIGVCVGSATEEKVLEKTRFDMKMMRTQDFESRCMEEFWSKHQDQLNKLTKNAKPPGGQTLAFRELIDKWDRTHELYILCDNPAFDVGMINTYLDLFQQPTLHYRRNSDGSLSYRNIHDADSYGRGVLNQGLDSQWFSNKGACEKLKTDLNPDSHDHMPENDAEFIYRLHWQLIQHNKKA